MTEMVVDHGVREDWTMHLPLLLHALFLGEVIDLNDVLMLKPTRYPCLTVPRILICSRLYWGTKINVWQWERNSWRNKRPWYKLWFLLQVWITTVQRFSNTASVFFSTCSSHCRAITTSRPSPPSCCRHVRSMAQRPWPASQVLSWTTYLQVKISVQYSQACCRLFPPLQHKHGIILFGGMCFLSQQSMFGHRAKNNTEHKGHQKSWLKHSILLFLTSYFNWSHLLPLTCAVLITVPPTNNCSCKRQGITKWQDCLNIALQ